MSDHTNVTRRGFVQGAAAGMAGLGLASVAGTVAFAEEEASAEATATDEVGLRQHSAQLNPQGTFAPITNAQTPSIFTEWQFGSMTLPNRIVKSAAGYIGVTSQGIDAPLFLDYLAGLAKGGVSLLYTDDFVELYDHFKAGEEVGKIADWTPEQLANIAATVHDNGGKIGYQLATMGLIYSGFEPDPTAIFQTSTCMDMTAQEIQDFIADTIKAATILKDAGFDCVEINAAGENTGQTFMSRARNQRDDEYGPQTFESRTRFVCEIVSGIKEACGADFPVQVLINGVEENDKNIGDSELYTTVEDNKEMCKLIEAAGADALHVRIGPRGQHVAEFAGDLFFTGYGIEGTTSYGTQFDFKRHWQGMLKADQSGMGVMTKVAAELKKSVSIPVGCVTYMDPARDPEFFDGLIANGDIDFILMNRPLCVDPEYIHKLQDGRLDEIRPCTRCLHCHWDANDDGSLKFGCRTFAAHPNRIAGGQITGGYTPEPAAEPKKVMVAGSGPAGLEAAIVAAERGHEVTLYEKNGYIGGLLPFAALIKGPHENLDLAADLLRAPARAQGRHGRDRHRGDCRPHQLRGPRRRGLGRRWHARQLGPDWHRRHLGHQHRRRRRRRDCRRRGDRRLQRPGDRPGHVPARPGQACPDRHTQRRLAHRSRPLVLGEVVHPAHDQGPGRAYLERVHGERGGRRRGDRRHQLGHHGPDCLRHPHRGARRAAHAVRGRGLRAGHCRG